MKQRNSKELKMLKSFIKRSHGKRRSKALSYARNGVKHLSRQTIYQMSNLFS